MCVCLTGLAVSLGRLRGPAGGEGRGAAQRGGHVAGARHGRRRGGVHARAGPVDAGELNVDVLRFDTAFPNLWVATPVWGRPVG